MSAIKSCRSCGAGIPGNAPFGHCPKCLLDLGFGPAPGESAAPPATTTQGARIFGDYELLQQIGRGGMGVVYKARQVRLNRLVAIKMIRAGEFASPTLIQRFHREAEATANLQHPNIVSIYETGEIQGQHYLSMALIEGDSLDDHILRSGTGGPSVEKDVRSSVRARMMEIARIMAKVARAVDHAHQHGVLHRDLKPSNILVDRRGEPHLTDFGLAKVIGRGDSNLTVTGAIMGTPSFMAPEQASGNNKSTSTLADVYSLGAILYAMLTGQPPFRADTPVETLKQVVEQEPKHPSTLREGIDSDLSTIAMKCLEKEPKRRYPSAAALAEDLERWLRKEPIQARPVQTAERFWRWCRRNPAVSALCGTVMLLVMALIVVLVSLVEKERDRREIAEERQRLAEGAREQVLGSLSKLYSDTNTHSFTIKAEVRHALVSRSRVPEFAGEPMELTFVDYGYGHPTNVLSIFAPILETLEWDLARRFRRPVLINLQMLQSYDLGYDDLIVGRMTFGRVGPSSFSQLLDRRTGVRLVAMQDQTRPLTLAVFARTNSPVARIFHDQPDFGLAVLLAGRSVAFGNAQSTTGNYVPRAFLAASGVFATNLSRYLNLMTPAAVIEAVRSNRFDVGAVNVEVLRKEADMVVVARFEVGDLGRCWVAGRGLPEDVFTALRDSLLQMRDPAIIGRIESELDGFKVVDEAALNHLRKIMRDAAAFDAPHLP